MRRRACCCEKSRSYLPRLATLPVAVEYDDYRDTGSGVKFPFVIRNIPGAPYTLYSLVSHSTIRVQKVQNNVAVDDAKFAKPQSAPAAK